MNPQSKSTALSADLNNFILGVSRRNSQNAPELTKIGLNLLNVFPAARDAVLEYFGLVFNDAVNVFINQNDYEHDLGANGSLESVSMIGPELCSLGQAWAPFIAPWCINLIMDIATKKQNVPNATLQSAEPVRILLDITTQNLTLLQPDERAKCIDMMLGSWACSWAIGFVGRAEPALVAPRALALGPEAARAVLAHLANHPPALFHVRAALRDLFQEAIKEDAKPEKKRDVIPYLLNLASKSDIVLKALTQDIEQTLTPDVVARLSIICSSHCNAPGWEAARPAALVSLLARSDVRCLLLLLHFAKDIVFCRQLLEYLLQQLEYESLKPGACGPLVQSAGARAGSVRERLLAGEPLQQHALARLLVLVCEYLLQQLEYESLKPGACGPLVQSAGARAGSVRERLLAGEPLQQHALARLLVLVCEYLLQQLEYESLKPGACGPLVQSAGARAGSVRERLLAGEPLQQHALARLLVLVCEYLLQQLEYESLKPGACGPLVQSAGARAGSVRERLLAGEPLQQHALARLLVLVCYNLPSEFVITIAFLLQYSRDDKTLALLVRIISGTLAMHAPADSPDISMDTERYQNFIKTGVEYALRDSMMSDMEIKKCFIEGTVDSEQKTYLHYFCMNIIKLLRWENSNRVSHLRTRPFGRAVEASLQRLGAALQQYSSLLREKLPCTLSCLDGMDTCHALAEVLDRVDMSGTKAPPPSVEAILKVVQATVNYFFRCMHLKDIMSKLRGVQTACRLLRKLCVQSELARAVALRDLLETAMFREEKTFGSRSVVPNTVPPQRDWAAEDLLILMNQKHGPITQLTQSHTSVFHAGIIGKGVRRQGAGDADTPPILTTNNELLMAALMSCMDGNSGIVEGATSLSLLLVELVSPDVMYNGLPWPDEDFTKQVSIERELYMRGALESCSVARSALRRAAAARPALCLASALLRATAASLLHRHKATREQEGGSLELGREAAALGELLATMTLGQLLPPPLDHLLELTPELTPSETVQVLRDCLWNYTRDNVPAPALFTCDATGLHWRDSSNCKPPTTYTDTLRIIIQKRISKLGHLYPIMFLNLEKESS